MENETEIFRAALKRIVNHKVSFFGVVRMRSIAMDALDSVTALDAMKGALFPMSKQGD